MPQSYIPVQNIVTLAEARAHLRIPAANTADDTALMGFIGAADDVIRHECGDVMPTVYDELYDGGFTAIFLRHRPVLSVENIEEGSGYQNFTLDYQQSNSLGSSMYAYSIDSPITGLITRRSAGSASIPFAPGLRNIRVQYTAGRESVPPSVRLAALELIAHWWQNSQLRSQLASASYTQFDSVNEDWTRASGISSINQGVPYRVLELLKPYRKLPVIG